MSGDYGTIHIELPADVDDELAQEIFEATTEIMDRFLSKLPDLLVSMHSDGPCATSPHCFGAEREDIARKIEAGRDSVNWAKTFRNGLDQAASIVRGAAA